MANRIHFVMYKENEENWYPLCDYQEPTTPHKAYIKTISDIIALRKLFQVKHICSSCLLQLNKEVKKVFDNTTPNLIVE